MHKRHLQGCKGAHTAVSQSRVGPCAAAASSSSKHPQHEYVLRLRLLNDSRSANQHKDAVTASVQHQTAVPWYDNPHSEQLREVLTLPLFRYQTLVQEEPTLLDYRPETLTVTLEALTQALHLNHAAVVQLLERRPGIIRHPHEPVHVLHQLAELVGRSPEQTSFLLTPYPQLLALTPHELLHRVRQLCTTMHWTQPQRQQPAKAAAFTGAAAFLQLLAAPVQRTAQQVAALSAMLDTPEQICTSLVQHRIVLLQMSPAVVHSRLFLLASAAGVSCCELLYQLDQQQMQCLSALLLLSPQRLQQQLDSLARTLQQLGSTNIVEQGSTAINNTQHQQRLLVHLLLRLGGPTAVAHAAVNMVTLRSIVRTAKHWQQELETVADDAELAVLLSASTESLAQARYLLHVGLEESMTLREVMLCPPEDFRKRFGQHYSGWLAGSV